MELMNRDTITLVAEICAIVYVIYVLSGPILRLWKKFKSFLPWQIVVVCLLYIAIILVIRPFTKSVWWVLPSVSLMITAILHLGTNLVSKRFEEYRDETQGFHEKTSARLDAVFGSKVAVDLVAEECLKIIAMRGGSIAEMKRSFEKLSDVEEVFSKIDIYEHSESESKTMRKAYIDSLRNLQQWLEQQSAMDDHGQAGGERHEST